MNKVLSKSLPILVTGALLTPLAAQAVPSFARQTGFSCAMCHTVWPQLTPYGRMFKLEGYTTSAGQFDTQSEQSKNLQEDTSAPLSVMMQISYGTQKANKTTSGTPPTATEATFEFPQQFSFFYAGRVSNDMGIFSQITYDDGGHFGMDNTDMRYAGKSADGSVLWGMSLNNVPGVEDLWNSTPVWGFPADHAPVTQDPGGIGGATLIGGDGLAGVTAFAMFNNSVYGELGMYHASNTNAGYTNPNAAGVLKDWAPYVRVAYQKDLNSTSNLEVGLTSMSGKLWDGTAGSTSTKVDDLGIDAQYQYLDGPNTATIRGMYTTEKTGSVKTHELNLNGSYYSNREIGGTVIYDATGGDSAAGQGETSVTVQANYLPYLNTKFAVAYTTYTKVPTGVSKSDYNTLYLLAWIMY